MHLVSQRAIDLLTESSLWLFEVALVLVRLDHGAEFHHESAALRVTVLSSRKAVSFSSAVANHVTMVPGILKRNAVLIV